MTIKSDNQGFLVGELVESNKDLIAGQNTSNRLLGGIKTDVSAIARALGVSSRSGGGRAAGGNSRAAVEPAGRGSSSRNGASGGRSPGSASTAAQRTGGIGAANARAAVSPTGRDNWGRFVAGAGGAGKSGGADGAGGGRLLDKLGSVADALKGMAGGGDQVDPSITALKEVKDVVAPLGRGAMALFGRSGAQKKERWYQRIWKSLTNIEKKPAGSVGGGDGGGLMSSLGGLLGGAGGMLGGILGKIPGLLMTVFSRVLMPVAALWGSFELGQWVGKKIYEWLDSSGIMAKVFDAFDAMSAGISGAWTTATEGFIKALDFLKSIPDRIGGVFDAIDQGIRKIPVIGDLYAKASDAAKNTAADVKKGYNEGKSGDATAPPASAAQAVGRDGGKVVGAVAAVGTQAKAGYDTARGKPTDAPAPSGPVQSFARGAGGAVGKGAAALNRWTGGARDDLTNASVTAGVDPGLVAQISNFESGFNSSATPTRKDGSKISSAHGYGQFLDGTWTDMVNKYGGKYGVEGAGKLSKAQAGALRNDPKLQASMLAEFTKENVVKGRAMGGSDDAANVYAFHNLGDGDAKRMLGALKTNPEMSARDALIGGRNIDEKERARIESVISGNKSLYGDGTISASAAYGRMGAKMREGEGYAADARALAGGFPAGQNTGIRTSVPTISVSPPALAQFNSPSSVPAKLPAMPEVNIPAPSTEKERPLAISIRQPIGQDIGDRGIAHIVSGGIGSA